MSDRKVLIAGNWKMFKTGPEALQTATELVRRAGSITQVDIMIAPPFTALGSVREAIKGSQIALGAQNVYWEAEGPFTGEVSPAMLLDAGCRYVIVGHSERRQHFGETDEWINRKVKVSMETGLIPVFCIGETEGQRESGKTFSVLDKQIQMGLKEVFFEDSQALVVAYEPVWAIGTGKTASSQQAQEVHRFLRERLADQYGKGLADRLRILYGGSVKPDNVAELMSMPDLDGALVGGASLDPQIFAEIILYRNR
jgi:triosephosphate isomerase